MVINKDVIELIRKYNGGVLKLYINTFYLEAVSEYIFLLPDQKGESSEIASTEFIKNILSTDEVKQTQYLRSCEISDIRDMIYDVCEAVLQYQLYERKGIGLESLPGGGMRIYRHTTADGKSSDLSFRFKGFEFAKNSAVFGIRKKEKAFAGTIIGVKEVLREKGRGGRGEERFLLTLAINNGKKTKKPETESFFLDEITFIGPLN